MKKTISTIIALTLVATIGIAQDKPAATGEKPAADPIVIAGGETSIRQSEFESALKTLPAEYQQYAMGPGRKQFAQDFLHMKMLAAAGMKSGLDKSPEIQQQLSLMRENLVAQAQLKKIESEIVISDDDLKKAYEAEKDKYEQVKAKHILVAFKGSPAVQADKPELTEEQAKAKAEDLRKQIAGGASFDELAKKESDDTGSGMNGGDLGEFGRGQMVPEFEKAAFEAKVGDVTPVVRTQFGYHIIKVDDHNHTAFPGVKGMLEREERQKRLQSALDKMKASAKVTYNEAYFAPPAPPAPAEAPPQPETKNQ